MVRRPCLACLQGREQASLRAHGAAASHPPRQARAGYTQARRWNAVFAAATQDSEFWMSSRALRPARVRAVEEVVLTAQPSEGQKTETTSAKGNVCVLNRRGACICEGSTAGSAAPKSRKAGARTSTPTSAPTPGSSVSAVAAAKATNTAETEAEEEAAGASSGCWGWRQRPQADSWATQADS